MEIDYWQSGKLKHLEIQLGIDGVAGKKQQERHKANPIQSCNIMQHRLGYGAAANTIF